MRDFFKKLIRPSGGITDIFLIAGILSFALALGGEVIGGIICGPYLLGRVFSSLLGKNLGYFLGQYFSFIGIWIAVLLVIFLFKKNRPMLKGLAPNKKGNTLKGFGTGLLLGFLFNGACVLMSLLMGDIKLSFYGINLLILIPFFIAVLVQSGAEEVVDRLYLYQKLRRRYRSPVIAVVFNAVAFAAMHMGNPGFTLTAGLQILLVGMIWTLFVYYYDSLWAGIAFHTAWNFTQNLIFGLPNSGRVSEYSIFTLEAASARNGLFYNVNFGVEGSIGSCLLLAGLLVWLIVKNRNKPEATDLWAKMEAEAEAAAQTENN